MVNIESDQACMWWTFDSIEDLSDQSSIVGFGDSIWKENRIPSFAVGETHIAFDAPEDWGEGLPPVRFEKTSNNSYIFQGEGTRYEGARSDTGTHVILTGRWTESDYGTGIFIAVFPVNRRPTGIRP
jgi:hypothetical protein